MNSLQNFTKNNLCKVSRQRARDRDRNPSRPRRDLRPSRPKLQKTDLETETKSRDSITAPWAPLNPALTYRLTHLNVEQIAKPHA